MASLRATVDLPAPLPPPSQYTCRNRWLSTSFFVVMPARPRRSLGRTTLRLKGSVERGVVALQQGRRVADGRSLIHEAMPEGDLIGSKLGWATEADAAFLGGLAPGAGPLVDEGPLELGDAGEHGQDHSACGRGGVGPGLGE